MYTALFSRIYLTVVCIENESLDKEQRRSKWKTFILLEDGKIFVFHVLRKESEEEVKNNCTMLIWKSDMFYTRIYFLFIIWCAIESDETVDDEKSEYKVCLSENL